MNIRFLMITAHYFSAKISAIIDFDAVKLLPALKHIHMHCPFTYKYKYLSEHICRRDINQETNEIIEIIQ